MAQYDLLITGGKVATASDTFDADVGIKDGVIVALGKNLGADGNGGSATAKRIIDAAGKLVLPGGVEAHCHIEQESAAGLMAADDYYSGSVSAAFGGNTTIIPFAAQHRGQALADVLDTYHGRAEPKSVIDYSFHMILSDPSESVLNQELPLVFEQGIMSFKVYMTYDLLRIDDGQMLDILDVAQRHGALTMVHAENDALIRWMSNRLLAGGYRDPRYHQPSHPRAAEAEAIGRATHLAGFLDAPMLIVHVSTAEGADIIGRARQAGQKIFGETCPHYLFLEAGDMDIPGPEAAKFCCSPPLRRAGSQEAIWRAIQTGTFQLVSSDHAPYRFDGTGKLHHSPDPDFKHCANGLPGIEVRMPLMFSEGVRGGRISLNQFVALTSTNAAKIYGLHPRKGTIAIGADADLAIWDPELERRLSVDMLHDNLDYTPYDGKSVTGWPVTVINRGRIVVEDEELRVERGSGQFLKRDPVDCTGMPGQQAPELDPARNFGAELR